LIEVWPQGLEHVIRLGVLGNSASNTEVLSARVLVGYGVGDIAFNVVTSAMGLYLLYYYTDVFGISAATAGTIFLVGRGWDAVSDPIMGYVADRGYDRWGRYRPFLLAGAPPLGLAFALCFFSPTLSPTGMVAWALITYLLLSTFFTVASIPYLSMSAALTRDAHQRTRLSASRMIFGIVAMALVAVGTQPLVGLFDNEQEGFRLIFAGFGGLIIITILATYSLIEEKPAPTRSDTLSVSSTLQAVMKNSALLVLCVASLFGVGATTIRGAVLLYYFKYNLGREDLVPLFFLFMILAFILGVALTTPAARRFEKKHILLAAKAVLILMSIGIYFTPYSAIVLVFVLPLTGMVASGAIHTMLWSMLPDTVEYGQWRTGLRVEGATISIYSFISKASAALGGMAAGWYLSYVGFVANVDQTERATHGILEMFAIMPLILITLSFIAVIFYNIDNETFEKIKTYIGQK
jgi:sugar (glycoside-pentoside-hexuronide) transporter